jgi:hypothetical protein
MRGALDPAISIPHSFAVERVNATVAPVWRRPSSIRASCANDDDAARHSPINSHLLSIGFRGCLPSSGPTRGADPRCFLVREKRPTQNHSSQSQPGGDRRPHAGAHGVRARLENCRRCGSASQARRHHPLAAGRHATRNFSPGCGHNNLGLCGHVGRTAATWGRSVSSTCYGALAAGINPAALPAL